MAWVGGWLCIHSTETAATGLDSVQHCRHKRRASGRKCGGTKFGWNGGQLMGHGDNMLPRRRCLPSRRVSETLAAGLAVVWSLLASAGTSIGWSAPPESGSTTAPATSRTAEANKTTDHGFLRPSVRRSGGTAPAQSGNTARGTEERESIAARLRRRLEVCDRIKVIALETGDARLEAAANEVENLIWQWYLEETSQRNTVVRGQWNRSAGTSWQPSSSSTVQSSQVPSADENASTPLPSAEPQVVERPASVSNNASERPAISPAFQELQHRLDRRDVRTIRGSSAGDVVSPLRSEAPAKTSSTTQGKAGMSEESP
jgi:hypothetical protein